MGPILSFKYSLHFILLWFLFGCLPNSSSLEINTEGDWQEPKLEERTVFDIKMYNNRVYAGTDDGLYRKQISDTEWQSIGLKGAKIWAFAPLSDQEILASIYYLDENGPDSATIAKTMNGGDHWFPYLNNFGGEYRRIPFELERKPGTDNLFARGGYNVARSQDRGGSWESVYLEWGHAGAAQFIELDPLYPDVIWTGGATAIFGHHLIRSEDNGETWERLKLYDHNSDANVNGLLMHPEDRNRLMASTGGFANGIRISSDFGKTWRVTYDKTAVYSLLKSTRDGRIAYAASLKEFRTIAFLVTADFGETWEEIILPDSPQFMYIYDLAVAQQGKAEILYLATSHGVYSYTFHNLLNQ